MGIVLAGTIYFQNCPPALSLNRNAPFKMSQKLRNTLTIFLLLIVYSGWSQTTNINYSYTDIYGNYITIATADKLPAQLDTTFFKLNLTGLHFDKTLPEKNIRYDYTLSDIKRTEKKNEFKFTLTIVPHTKEIEEVLKYLGGPGHYKMTVQKENNKFRIDAVEFMYGEI
ncbi:MAG: hypothetical protein IPH20_04350 [Bacteroidales bacterium]|nr:hypothetical protein [Bacteroidales bacterium]